MKKRKTFTIKDKCYIAGTFLLISLIVFRRIMRGQQITPTQFGKPCLFYFLTGYYCPGCGGTRAVEALLFGQWIKSFLYHPIVLCAAGLYAAFMASHTITLLSRGRLDVTIKFHQWYLWAALILIIVQCTIKNLILYFLYYK